ncbi:MAG: hypothetical protein K9L28_01245 [Synergistales bacterium]|nr:hypothetical protein [Synergistales bacterium]
MRRYRAHNDCRRYITITLTVIAFVLTAGSVADAAPQPTGTPSRDGQEEYVTLDADRVTYDETGGVATAEGNANLRYKGLLLQSPYMQMNTRTSTIEASGTGDRPVVINWQGRRLTGQKVDYDLRSESGTISKPSGSVDAVRLYGEQLRVLPVDKAVSEDIITRRQARAAEPGGQEQVAEWKKGTFTTCPERPPHYRLESSRILVLPGKKVRVKSPAIYLGETQLFRYPFDYIVDLRRRTQETSFMPLVGYDEDRGAGIGIAGPYEWESGRVSAGIQYWTKTNLEGWASFRQKVGERSSVFYSTSYSWDSDSDRRIWRPKWGIETRYNDWKAVLQWSEKEKLDFDKALGERFEGTLWRYPELSILGPWERDSASGAYWRFSGSWGSYKEDSVYTDRTAGSVELYSEDRPRGNAVPFWKGRVQQKYYSADDAGQTIYEAVAGVDWYLGSLPMTTSYFQRWVRGDSPMRWDDYDDVRELYQWLSVPFDRRWTLSMRGGYDLKEEDLEEMAYLLDFDQGCLLWQLTVRDDLVGDNDWVGLLIEVTAFPGQGVALGENELDRPGAVPEGIPHTNRQGVP